jgi:hypothetical protein
VLKLLKNEIKGKYSLIDEKLPFFSYNNYDLKYELNDFYTK